MTRLDGIDVSHYQGVVAWPAVKANGAKIAACKATQGTASVDPTFARNRAGMAAAGFAHRFVYHWLDATPAKDQAAHFLATIGALADGEGVILDVEDAALLHTKQAPDARAAEWCQYVEAATGRPPMIYAGAFFDGGRVWRSPSLYLSTIQYAGAPLARGRILPAYTDEAKARSIAAPQRWDVWQYTSTAAVPGVPTPCDALQLDQWTPVLAACHTIEPTPPEDDDMPATPFPTTAAILTDERYTFALLVGAGGEPEWLSPERRNGLVAAGVPQIAAKAHASFIDLAKRAGIDDPTEWAAGVKA